MPETERQVIHHAPDLLVLGAGIIAKIRDGFRVDLTIPLYWIIALMITILGQAGVVLWKMSGFVQMVEVHRVEDERRFQALERHVESAAPLDQRIAAELARQAAVDEGQTARINAHLQRLDNMDLRMNAMDQRVDRLNTRAETRR